MQLTRERLAELRRIAEAATPGPWDWLMSKDGRILDLITLETGHNEDIITPSHINAWLQVKDGAKDFIPAFDPPTVLALLDEIERLMERQSKVRHALRAAVNHIGEPQHPYERAGISHLQLALQVLDGRYDREGGGREYLAEDGDGNG